MTHTHTYTHTHTHTHRVMRNSDGESDVQTIAIGDQITNLLTLTGQLVLLGTQPPVSRIFISGNMRLEATRFEKQKPACGNTNNIQLSQQLIDQTITDESQDTSQNAAVDCIMAQLKKNKKKCKYIYVSVCVFHCLFVNFFNVVLWNLFF